jgi:hypothetical protein
MRHVGRPTSGVEISVEVREPVAQVYKALVEDQGHVTSEAPDNQPNLNPPPDWHKHKKPLQQPAMKSPRENGGQVQDHHFPGKNTTDPVSLGGGGGQALRGGGGFVLLLRVFICNWITCFFFS